MTLDEMMEISNDMVHSVMFQMADVIEDILLRQAESDEDAEAISVDLDAFINFGVRLAHMGWSSEELITLLSDTIRDIQESSGGMVQ